MSRSPSSTRSSRGSLRRLSQQSSRVRLPYPPSKLRKGLRCSAFALGRCCRVTRTMSSCASRVLFFKTIFKSSLNRSSRTLFLAQTRNVELRKTNSNLLLSERFQTMQATFSSKQRSQRTVSTLESQSRLPAERALSLHISKFHRLTAARPSRTSPSEHRRPSESPTATTIR